MPESLRVLQVLTSLDRGGMETMTMNFYRHMNRNRIQFDFLLHREKEGDYEAEARSLGASIYSVPRQNPLSPHYLKALDRFFEEHPYQVVHVQLDCMSAPPLAAARRHGAAVRIAHSHNSRQDKDLKYPMKLVYKRLIRREATDLFACGVDAGKWMFGTDDFRVLRNAIDVDGYAFDAECRERVRRELHIGENALAIGHVGRFAPAKNHAFILDVFAGALKLHPDAVLILVGDGELRPEAERRAQSLGVYDSVRFLGVRSDVAGLMQAMDIFLMPSVYEGLPLVLVEAQAAGLPCLISDSIPRDCDFKGSTIERMQLSESPASWAAALVGMRGDSSDRAKGPAVVRAEGFDIRAEAERLARFYARRLEELG